MISPGEYSFFLLIVWKFLIHNLDLSVCYIEGITILRRHELKHGLFLGDLLIIDPKISDCVI